MTNPLARLVTQDDRDFHTHQQIVMRGLPDAIKLKQALDDIERGELWRSNGYESFQQFCEQELGSEVMEGLRLLDEVLP